MRAPEGVAPANAQAQAEGHITAADIDLDFGVPPLGSTISMIPSGMHRAEHCYETGYIDCEYSDESGVNYLVFGRTLTRKRIVVDGRARPNLPFGLRGDETAEQALQALNARFGPVFSSYRMEDRSGLATGNLRTARGYEYSADIALTPDGRIAEISVGGVAE